jgi:uroporphyrinogen decarboxylase
MKPKQRFINALNFREPDDVVSMMEVEFQIHEEYVGEALTVGAKFAKLSRREKDYALARNAEILIQTAQKAGHDVIREIGGYWEVAPGVPAFLYIDNIEDRLELIRLVKKMSGDEYFILCFAGWFISVPEGNRIDDFITTLYDEPESLRIQAEEMLTASIETQKRYIDAGADGIGAAADIAFKTGTFLSPSQLDEFFFPYFYRWVQSVKNEGLPSIWHTDGNLNAVMDRILESGVSALQCIDPLAEMDIIELKKIAYGKMALIGNLDCSILQTGPKEIIELQAKQIIEGCMDGGGFIFGGCNAIFKGISAENYQVMVNARNKYGRYKQGSVK